MDTAGMATLNSEVQRVLSRLRRRRVRSRWMFLAVFPAVAALFSRIYYQSSSLSLTHAAAAFAVGATLLGVRWAANRQRRPVHEFLENPGDVLDHFISPDRGLVFFNETGVFVEKTRHFWTYEGDRIRIHGIDFEPEHRRIHLEASGRSLVPPAPGMTKAQLMDDLIIEIPVDFSEERVASLLSRVRPHLADKPQE